MKKIPSTVLAALLVLAALWLASTCGERRGAANERAKARDRVDDAVAVQLRAQRDSAILASNVVRDSTGREIRRLRARLSIPSTSVKPRPDTALGAQGAPEPPVPSTSPCAGAPVQCDSLITVLTEARRADSLEILFWRAQSDSALALTDRLRASRDAYRREASKPSYMVTDLGGAALVGYGVADKCETCVLAGVATVALPRLLGGLKRIL